MQASIDSQTSMMLLKDLSSVELPGAQVWVLTCLVSFLDFLVISSLVLPIGRTTAIAMIASKYCFH
jgi:hypothetical protein